MTNPYVNSCTKVTEKQTLGQIDEVENFVQSDVWKINITDNIWFSRYLFLEQFFILVQTVTRLFAQNIGILDLIQSGFVVCAFYRQFSIGSLRMSEKRGTLEGFGFKKARPIDDGMVWKNIERKEENAVQQQFFPFFFFFNVFHPIMTEYSSWLGLKSSANASNLELPTI